MGILQSYYQDVYKCPVVRLSGYSGRHGLASSVLAYLDFGGATAPARTAWPKRCSPLPPSAACCSPACRSWRPAPAVSARRWLSSCATTGHPCILVVPSSLPASRRQHLQNLGARIVVCSGGGRKALERIAADTAKRYNGYFTNYFANDDNAEYHRRVTGPQILKSCGDAIDAVVIGVGSGGTITGTAEYLKAWNSMIRVVAVEPSECAAIAGGFIGPPWYFRHRAGVCARPVQPLCGGHRVGGLHGRRRARRARGAVPGRPSPPARAPGPRWPPPYS